MEIEEVVKNVESAAKSSVEIELKSHYLLGDTNEFDDFLPDLVSLTGRVFNPFWAFHASSYDPPVHNKVSSLVAPLLLLVYVAVPLLFIFAYYPYLFCM